LKPELTKIEEILLLSIWRLGEEAYGVRIRRHVSELTGKQFTYGNLYSALNQMVRKKYVSKRAGEVVPERRGRPRIFYALTRQGKRALGETRALNDRLWAEIPRHAFPGGSGGE
jgi:DNA-binding PadR family transcriptional regulator